MKKQGDFKKIQRALIAGACFLLVCFAVLCVLALFDSANVKSLFDQSTLTQSATQKSDSASSELEWGNQSGSLAGGGLTCSFEDNIAIATSKGLYLSGTSSFDKGSWKLLATGNYSYLNERNNVLFAIKGTTKHDGTLESMCGTDVVAFDLSKTTIQPVPVAHCEKGTFDSLVILDNAAFVIQEDASRKSVLQKIELDQAFQGNKTSDLKVFNGQCQLFWDDNDLLVANSTDNNSWVLYKVGNEQTKFTPVMEGNSGNLVCSVYQNGAFYYSLALGNSNQSLGYRQTTTGAITKLQGPENVCQMCSAGKVLALFEKDGSVGWINTAASDVYANLDNAIDATLDSNQSETTARVTSIGIFGTNVLCFLNDGETLVVNLETNKGSLIDT